MKIAFGRGLKVVNYNGSLLIEIMELLDTIVLEADATNPIMHTVGNGIHRGNRRPQWRRQDGDVNGATLPPRRCFRSRIRIMAISEVEFGIPLPDWLILRTHSVEITQMGQGDRQMQDCRCN